MSEEIPPSPSKMPPPRKKQSIARRVQALSLHGAGISFAVITKTTGYGRSSFYELRQKAISRGYVDGGPVLDEHVIDGKRTGRPTKAQRAAKAQQQEVPPHNDNDTTALQSDVMSVQLLALAEAST